jgi:hypothetical protein
LRHEVWTCGSFHPDALHLLQKAKATTLKYEIDWKDGTGIQEYAKLIKAPGIRKMLDEHYFKHPLASIEQLASVEELPQSA